MEMTWFAMAMTTVVLALCVQHLIKRIQHKEVVCEEKQEVDDGEMLDVIQFIRLVMRICVFNR